MVGENIRISIKWSRALLKGSAMGKYANQLQNPPDGNCLPMQIKRPNNPNKSTGPNKDTLSGRTLMASLSVEYARPDESQLGKQLRP